MSLAEYSLVIFTLDGVKKIVKSMETRQTASNGWEAYDAPNKKWSSAMILNTNRKYIFFTHNTSRGHAFPLICSEKIHGTEIDKDDTV